MDLPFAIGLFVAALAVTYFTCIRPMRRGQGHCGMGAALEGIKDSDAKRRAEIARLREEIESLKAPRG